MESDQKAGQFLEVSVTVYLDDLAWVKDVDDCLFTVEY